MIDEKISRKIEKNAKDNPQYYRLNCLNSNKNKIKCPDCPESKTGCKEMLRAYKYPPYTNR